MRNVQNAFCRVTSNMLEDLACETQVLVRDDALDSTNLKRVSKTFVSITNRAHHLFGAISRNKVHVEIENTEKGICKVASDQAKARLLKETLRSKGIVTNTAIQQYLIQDEVNSCILERDGKSYKSNDFSSAIVRGKYEPYVSITKEKHGYQWKNPVATSSSKYTNIRIMREKEFE